jgi:hypothetical protein
VRRWEGKTEVGIWKWEGGIWIDKAAGRRSKKNYYHGTPRKFTEKICVIP